MAFSSSAPPKLWLALATFAMLVCHPALAVEEKSDPTATRVYAVASGLQQKQLYSQAVRRWQQFIDDLPERPSSGQRLPPPRRLPAPRPAAQRGGQNLPYSDREVPPVPVAGRGPIQPGAGPVQRRTRLEKGRGPANRGSAPSPTCRPASPKANTPRPRSTIRANVSTAPATWRGPSSCIAK